MEVEVGKFRISRNEEGWVIHEKYIVGNGKNAGSINWINPKYYHRLDHAVSNLFDRMIRTSDPVDDIKSLEERVIQCQQQLLIAVKEVEKTWLKDRSIYIP